MSQHRCQFQKCKNYCPNAVARSTPTHPRLAPNGSHFNKSSCRDDVWHGICAVVLFFGTMEQSVMADKHPRIEFSAQQTEEFDRAFELLGGLIDLNAANEMYPKRANAVYTACVVLWMLIYQRLKPDCLLYTSPSPRDLSTSRMPSSA